MSYGDPESNCHEINAKAISLDLDSNPELYIGGWELQFEPRALWRRLRTLIRTPSSIEEAGNPEPRGGRSKIYKEGSSSRKKRFLMCYLLSQLEL